MQKQQKNKNINFGLHFKKKLKNPERLNSLTFKVGVKHSFLNVHKMQQEEMVMTQVPLVSIKLITSNIVMQELMKKLKNRLKRIKPKPKQIKKQIKKPKLNKPRIKPNWMRKLKMRRKKAMPKKMMMVHIVIPKIPKANLR